ncbi:hypothetical protein GCM10023328_47890 [Modestobacter marinus]|uniref:Uncharacterized protein n=1 Tax=Modestobacter marinus TaxID=477641 RepID=A0ABQ2GDF3_9ACTN|nr:hypothetical protein GCM10011589_47700 [Modestobacter marinus]
MPVAGRLVCSRRAASADTASVTYGYHPAANELVDADRTIQRTPILRPAGSPSNGKDYELLPFHVHTPNERTDLSRPTLCIRTSRKSLPRVAHRQERRPCPQG